MSRKFFVSTTGAGAKSALDHAFELRALGFSGLELSGGVYDAEWHKKLEKLNLTGEVVLHNYFPVPAESVVLNLASLDPSITKRSIDFIIRSIDLSAQMGAKWYGIHSGFLYDPNASELGSELIASQLYGYQLSYDNFLQNVKFVGNHAKKRGVRLLVENHVLDTKNYNNFDSLNPLLMVEPNEILKIMHEIYEFAGLLLDVGHLKVSAKTLGFDLEQALIDLNSFTDGYQLSDNDGNFDLHDNFDNTVWFAKLINDGVDYITFELKKPDIEKVENFISYLNNKRGNK
jgi:sugar phosphate isomerase/epimerase